MHKILNYQIEKEIYHSANSTLYLAKKEVADNGNIEQKFILKLLSKDFPSPEEIARFKREFEITRSLNEEGIIKVYELLKYKNTYIIVLEYFEGDSIANFLSSNTFAVNEVLPIAISIAESLGNVHKNKIIHKDINPFNIVWNLKTGKVKIIDFGISSELSH
ncbi:protein kinase, partial [Dolichospermum sp. ST_sed3]|nr:protein kinase [Dolichospermum sp. ST_sed3]